VSLRAHIDMSAATRYATGASIEKSLVVGDRRPKVGVATRHADRDTMHIVTRILVRKDIDTTSPRGVSLQTTRATSTRVADEVTIFLALVEQTT